MVPTQASDNYSMDQLNEALDILASVIEIHGARYLPLFEKVLKEYEKRSQQQSTLDIALNRAKKKRKTAIHSATQTDIHLPQNRNQL